MDPVGVSSALAIFEDSDGATSVLDYNGMPYRDDVMSLSVPSVDDLLRAGLLPGFDHSVQDQTTSSVTGTPSALIPGLAAPQMSATCTSRAPLLDAPVPSSLSVCPLTPVRLPRVFASRPFVPEISDLQTSSTSRSTDVRQPPTAQWPSIVESHLRDLACLLLGLRNLGVLMSLAVLCLRLFVFCGFRFGFRFHLA